MIAKAAERRLFWLMPKGYADVGKGIASDTGHLRHEDGKKQWEMDNEP